MMNGPGSPSYELWIRMNADRRPPMIRKVPEVFRQKESCKGCFDPMVVSIGPYHHGKYDLQNMERLKYSLTLNFVENSEELLRTLYAGVQQIYDDARRSYPEETVSKFNENAFTTLMLVDGCFVLQFINSFVNNNRKVEHMKSNIAGLVRRDLMLLENQLPYIVLEKLMMIRKNLKGGLIDKFIRSFRGELFPQTTTGRQTTTCIETTFKIFDKCRSIFENPSSIGQEETNNMNKPPQQQDPANTHPPLHLLDIFLRRYINTKYLQRKIFQERQDRDFHSYPAAKELKALGIHFKPSPGEHFTDIDINSTLPAGWVSLPRIMIDDTTKSMLSNLVAYEASPDAPDDLCGLTSYICFMDSLIDEAEDVKVLKSQGIVINLLGTDQQAADLFNGIARDLVPNSYAFGVSRQLIEENFRSRIRNWVAEFISTHFSSPWTLIAFIAVTATIVMTFLQTFYTVKGYYSGKGK